MRTIIFLGLILVCVMNFGDCFTLDFATEREELDEMEAENNYVTEKEGLDEVKDKTDIQSFGQGGVTYIRWGNASCGHSAFKIYDGVMAGSHYAHYGGAANWICLHNQPQYLSEAKATYFSLMYGAEYEFYGQLLNDRTNFDAPCALCQSPRRFKIMIPGRIECPNAWTEEYRGYLISGHYSHPSNKVYECLDESPGGITNSHADIANAYMYFVTAVCGYGIPCSPNHYVNNRAVTCVVCTQ